MAAPPLVQSAVAQQKWLACAICGYEVAAITTGRVPTITQLCTRYRPLGPVLIAALAIHLRRQPKRREVIWPWDSSNGLTKTAE